MTDLDTKEKILRSAGELFAHRGFEGTSVRDISDRAGVNVAAINYHFGQKETLYHEVLKKSYELASYDLSQLYESKKHDSFTYSQAILDYLFKKSDDLHNTFRMFISADSKSIQPQLCEDQRIGPPAAHLLLEVLKNSSGCKDEESLIWAVRTIYSYIMHLTLIKTSACDDTQKDYFSKNDLDKGLKRLVKIIVSDLKSNKIK